MLTGGNAPPYPRNCEQDCHLGPNYAHGRLNVTAPWYYAVVDVGGTFGAELGITAEPPGNYAPIELYNADDCDGYRTPTGPWIGNYYTLVGGITGYTAPAPTWNRVQTLTAAAIASAGTGYMIGDSLGPPDGTAVPTSAAFSLTVTSVDGSGGIVSAAITAPGGYYSGATPASPSHVTGGHGSGATFSLTFAGGVVNFG